MNAGRKVPSAYMLKLNNAPDKMIHHKVGTRRRVDNDPLLSAARVSSDAPRAGSRTRSNRGTRRMAGAPALTMAARQPHRCAIGPHNKKLSAPPTGTPSMNRDRTRAWRFTGNRSSIQLVLAGGLRALLRP